MAKINPDPAIPRTPPPVQSLDIDYLESRAAQLYNQLEQLVTTQMELARTEIAEKIRQTKHGANSLALGGTLAFYGGQAVLAGIVLLVNLWVDTLWISALSVGVVVALVGYGLIASGKKALDPSHLKPEKTMRSLHEDASAITRRTR